MIRFMILSCSAAKAVCLTDNGVWTTTWQNRPLSDIFPIVFIDAIHFSVRGDGIIRKLAAYVVLGINGDGYKGVMTIKVAENENSKYWLGVLNSLKNCGVKDILILSSDEEPARGRLEDVTEKWESQYPNAIKRWQGNWDVITPVYKFSTEVRKAFYTTNAIESLNSSYRRLNRQRSVFPSSRALLKALYVATFEAT